MTYMTNTFKNFIEREQLLDECGEICQQYASPVQLARLFGVNKTTMWRQLEKLKAENLVKPLYFTAPSGSKGHPRFCIKEVKAGIEILSAREVKCA